MSRLGDFFSDTFAQAKSHEPNWVQRLPSMPGSAQSLQDAFIANRWSHPYGHDQNSMDIFAGGVGHPAGSEHPWARTVGRAVGSYFIGRGLNNATGTNYAAPAARGIGNLFSGGGGGGLGGGGLGGLMDMGGMGGMPTQSPMGVIPPIQTYRDPMAGGDMLPPGLMALLLSMQNQSPADSPSGPALGSGGGVI